MAKLKRPKPMDPNGVSTIALPTFWIGWRDDVVGGLLLRKNWAARDFVSEGHSRCIVYSYFEVPELGRLKCMMLVSGRLMKNCNVQWGVTPFVFWDVPREKMAAAVSKNLRETDQERFWALADLIERRALNDDGSVDALMMAVLAFTICPVAHDTLKDACALMDREPEEIAKHFSDNPIIAEEFKSLSKITPFDAICENFFNSEVIYGVKFGRRPDNTASEEDIDRVLTALDKALEKGELRNFTVEDFLKRNFRGMPLNEYARLTALAEFIAEGRIQLQTTP